MSGLIFLGALLVPIFLIAALIRGGLRARRDRIALKQLGKDFE